MPKAKWIKLRYRAQFWSAQAAQAFNQMAIAEFEIPHHFTDDVPALTAQANVLPSARTDLRHIPFVTIDGADAKDFDDAVFAEPIEQGGASLSPLPMYLPMSKQAMPWI